MRIAWAFLFLLPAAGFAQTAAPQRPIQDYSRAIDEVKSKLDPLLVDLRVLRARYDSPRAAPGLSAERTRLRGEIAEGLARMNAIEKEFRERKDQDDTLKVIAGITGYMAGRGLPNTAISDLSASLILENFDRDLKLWHSTTQLALDSEDAAFRGAVHQARVQQALWAAMLLLAGFLLAAVAFAVKTARAKARLETDISKFASSPGVVYLGVQTPVRPGENPQLAPVERVLGGNYLVGTELGRGGMGVVFEATDLGLRRKVAIKQLRKELQESPNELGALLAEARLVALLKHPNIVEIHSIFKDAGQVYLVFEHVLGRNLDHVLREHGKLAFRQARTVARQVGSALDYAHGQRVIHRDLKPSNVMITPEGKVKVMDFGIAYQARVTAGRSTASNPIGTPAYMAPEQELGSVSRESDIFALGVCLYELATGRLPFGGPNFLTQKREGRFAPPSLLESDLPTGLDAVIARALAPDPESRYHTAGEMLIALDALPDAVAAGE